ncbi:hypothetical protein Rsub_11110 [Raphidocelis subcapitata]|uniref:AB hydrolase-1 domain-containing protein n=1 Tax=Raphidocelis subcapitata TaxID=307507 RepID=A0A2V0PEQ6_9CHLO|nr:hypothetical protein Rsub_11110 [Raphidocelis subcapitata]|eukprot:GBF97999.1 hypothetical protein Rsub_11110 [Raphidocelis subcapitata]
MTAQQRKPPASVAEIPAEFAARSSRVALRAAVGTALFLAAAAALAASAARAAPAWQLAAAWAAAEVVFAFAVARHARRVGAVPEAHAPHRHDGAATARRFMEAQRYFKFTETYLDGWFRGAPLSSIKKGNLRELLAYGMWYSNSPAEVDAKGDGPLLDGMVDSLLADSGIKLEDGYNESLPFMSHLRDPLPSVYRPLAFYAGTELMALGTWAALWAAGFTRHDVAGFAYYTLPGAPGAAAAAGTPVLLAHGVAAGVLPYLGLLFTLAGTGRPLVVPEFRQVSMRLCAHVPCIEEVVGSVAAFLSAMRYDRVHVIGHSFGSLVSSRLVQLHPKTVASLTLLDPVCFGMFMPKLLHSFLYSPFPAGGKLLDMGVYFVSRELHMTATFCRRFFWSDYNLWAEHLPAHTLVCLSGEDRLCPASDVRRWLESETRARVLYEADAVHADMLMQPEAQQQLLQNWLGMVAECEGAASDGGVAAAVAAIEGEDLEAAAAAAGDDNGCVALIKAGVAGADWGQAKAEAGAREAAAGDAAAVAALLEQLRDQRARLAEREAAHAAAAERLLALVGAVERRRTAPSAEAKPPLSLAVALGAAAARRASSDEDGSSGSSGSSGVASDDGESDVAVLGHAPYWSARGAALRRRHEASGARGGRMRRVALGADARKGSMGVCLGDSASIDLGALAYLGALSGAQPAGSAPLRY